MSPLDSWRKSGACTSMLYCITQVQQGCVLFFLPVHRRAWGKLSECSPLPFRCQSFTIQTVFLRRLRTGHSGFGAFRVSVLGISFQRFASRNLILTITRWVKPLIYQPQHSQWYHRGKRRIRIVSMLLSSSTPKLSFFSPLQFYLT